jgi:ABC-type cobalt transport system substrate-binding protein
MNKPSDSGGRRRILMDKYDKAKHIVDRVYETNQRTNGYIEDDLKPAKGIINGLLLASMFYIAAAIVFYYIYVMVTK